LLPPLCFNVFRGEHSTAGWASQRQRRRSLMRSQRRGAGRCRKTRTQPRENIRARRGARNTSARLSSGEQTGRQHTGFHALPVGERGLVVQMRRGPFVVSTLLEGRGPTSALSHERPKGYVCVESGLPPTSDIRRRGWHDRFVPEAAVSNRSKTALTRSLRLRARAVSGAPRGRAPWQ
jgi:hypothetical protein